jgi:hypothetical protein
MNQADRDRMEMELARKDGAAFGFHPHMKGRRSKNDREAAKNAPVDLLRGAMAGAAGAPGDIEKLLRMAHAAYRGAKKGEFYDPSVDTSTALPTSDEILAQLPYGSDTPVSRAASTLGTLAGGAYTGPGAPIRAAAALPGALKHGAQEFARAAGQPAARITAPLSAIKRDHNHGLSLDDILAKVKHIDELGPAAWAEDIARPISSDVTGYHITQDITAPLKEGLLTNRSVGKRNMQGYAPTHVGGAYFWSHPQVARAQRERLFENDPDLPQHEGPILKFKVNEGKHNFVPDEDSGAEKWIDSFTEGSFATKNPVELKHLEAIYSGNPEMTKEQIRKALAATEKTAVSNQPFWYNPEGGQFAPFEARGMHNKVIQDPEFTAQLGTTPEQAMTETSPLMMGRYRDNALDLMQVPSIDKNTLAIIQQLIREKKLSPEILNLSAGENLFEGIPREDLLKALSMEELGTYKKYAVGGSVDIPDDFTTPDMSDGGSFFPDPDYMQFVLQQQR